MSTQLKIKSKHLGEEAKIIRFEERKLKGQLAYQKDDTSKNKLRALIFDLASHRRYDVRNENRSTFLARAYISGKPYKSFEPKIHNMYLFETVILPRTLKMVQKYGKRDTTMSDLLDWCRK